MKKKRLIILGIDSGILILAFLAAVISNFMIANLSPCYVTRFGILCPACGGTRCVSALCSGDFIGAIKFNPMFVAAFAYIAVFIVLLNIDFLFGNRFCEKVWRKMANVRVLIIWAIAFALFGILRNVF